MDKTEIKVSCIDQVLKITDAPIVASGGLSEVRVVFSFCDKWKGFAKTATFYRDIENVYYSVLDENDTCVVPWEVCYESGTFFFGVFGEKENTRRTSVTVRYKVKDGAITAEMTPSDPTPEVYDQIVAMLADMRESQAGFISLAEKTIADANTATQNAQTATANANNATVDANTASTRANQAAENANASANNANTEAGNAMQATAKANEATTNANKATSDARAATEETNTARENIQQTASEVLSSLSNAVFATPIECSASGEVVTVNDSSNQLLRGLSIYGKTVQNGTPTPETPVPLESVGESGAINTTVAGKNLLDQKKLSVINNKYINASGEVAASSSLNYFAIQLVPGLYTLSMYNIEHPNGLRIHAFDAGGAWLGELAYHDSAVNLAMSFTVPYNAHRITVNIPVGKVTLQLELGDSGTAYEPYKEPQTLTASTPNGLPGIPVSSGGNYTDSTGQRWICDEVDFARGVYVKRTVLLDTFAKIREETNTVLYSKASTATLTGGDSRKAICNVLAITKYEFTAADKLHFYTDSAKAVVYVPLGFDNSNNTIKVLAALATPIETPLSAEELAQYAALHSNKPTTTVFNDANASMKLDYVADTKAYIDNKFAAISAAMLNA